MARLFESGNRVGRGGEVTVNASIYEQESGDLRPAEVQISISACVGGVQPNFTLYVGEPAGLFNLAEQFKAAGVALSYAKKFEAKCGRINDGHACTMPAGSKCPDCGLSCHSIGGGD